VDPARVREVAGERDRHQRQQAQLGGELHRHEQQVHGVGAQQVGARVAAPGQLTAVEREVGK
jgi:hypothetical protein